MEFRVVILVLLVLGGATALLFLGLQIADSTAFQKLPRRLRVLVPSLGVALAASIVLGGMAGHWLLGLAPLAGPFLAPWAFPGWGLAEMWVHGGITLLAIAAHPARPNGFTGLVTVLGCGWWLMLGIGMTYSGA